MVMMQSSLPGLMQGSRYGKDWLAGENEICNAHQLSLWGFFGIFSG